MAVARNKNGKEIKNWKDPRANYPKPDFKQSEFVQYELTKEQQAQCKFWDVTLSELFAAMIKLTESGYKVTLRYDDRNKCQACWIIAPPGEHKNAGMILPGRGTTPEKAFKQCLFKHFNLFGEEWPSPMSKHEAEEIDD